MTLLKALFCKRGLSPSLGENLWSMIRAMMALVHCYLLEGIAFGEDGFLVLSWWCLVRCYKK
jgi:hypothetical protein